MPTTMAPSHSPTRSPTVASPTTTAPPAPAATPPSRARPRRSRSRSTRSTTIRTVTTAATSTASKTLSTTVNPVNDAPLASDCSATLHHHPSTTLFPYTTLSRSETSNANLTYAVVTGPTHGTLTGSGSSRTYTPDANNNGTESLTYKVTDRGVPDNYGAPSTSCDAAKSSATKTISITVNPVNDHPNCHHGRHVHREQDALDHGQPGQRRSARQRLLRHAAPPPLNHTLPLHDALPI